MGHASKAELRDMRRVEVNFQYHVPGRGRGRREDERMTRDVDISSLPRDEQAYFRIQQAQREQASRQIGNIVIPPARPRAGPGPFPPLSPSAVAPESSTAPSRRVVDNFPPLSTGRASAPPTVSAPPAPTRTPAPSNLPPEVAARHSKVLEKATQLLNNDTEKLAQFKSQVSSFRHSESTATDLIDRLWDIFNAKLDEFGKLITSTADLFDYDAKSKRTELLGAWNDWKIQVQFPLSWEGFNGGRCKKTIRRLGMDFFLNRDSARGFWRSSLLQRGDKRRIRRVYGTGLRLLLRPDPWHLHHQRQL